MNRACRLFTVYLTALLGSHAVRADGPVTAAGPVVIELFTLQGCSSCPPAEQVLGGLTARADVVALAVHVTYWDDLGWRDRFALPLADARQYRYVRALGLSTAYTPQMIVNGREDVMGSQAASVRRILSRASGVARIEARVAGDVLEYTLPSLGLTCDCDLLLVEVTPAENPREAATVVVRNDHVI